MDQGSIGVEIRSREKQDREGFFTGKRQSGNPEVARTRRSLAEIVRCPFCHFDTVPSNRFAAPQVSVIYPPGESHLRLPTDVRRIFAALFREPRLMNDMEQDSALPLRKPRPVDNDN